MPYAHGRSNPHRAQFRTGRVAKAPKGSRKSKPEIRPDFLDAMREQFEAERLAAEQGKPVLTDSGLSLSPNGACHDCGRAVAGERRFCGPCFAKH